ncbi:MAG: PilZ domain-containing protein [Lachnospiraceae bacterium]|nr:PilZ domain-containing protein [Lachnospiraceae bacterium]
MEFMEIGTESQIVLCLHSDQTRTDFRLDAKIMKYLDKTTAIIQFFIDEDAPLNFESVRINLEYKIANSAPYFWNHAKLVRYQGNYILRVPHAKGVKINRRSSYRVPIGTFARTNHDKLPSAVVRDISHSGFALSSNKNEIVLKVGEVISAAFTDQGFTIHLKGRLVRTEQREGMVVYGFYFITPCPNLDQYIALKQRPLRKKK